MPGRHRRRTFTKLGMIIRPVGLFFFEGKKSRKLGIVKQAHFLNLGDKNWFQKMYLNIITLSGIWRIFDNKLSRDHSYGKIHAFLLHVELSESASHCVLCEAALHRLVWQHF